MNEVFISWAETVLMILMVLSFLFIVLNDFFMKKESGGNQAGEATRRLVEITDSDVNIIVMPAPEELEEIERSVESAESFSMDGDGPTDLEMFSSEDIGEERMREVIENLLRSGMEIHDSDGNRLTLEQVVGQMGESEEIVRDGVSRSPRTDPDVSGTRKGRMGKALDRLSSDSKQRKI